MCWLTDQRFIKVERRLKHAIAAMPRRLRPPEQRKPRSLPNSGQVSRNRLFAVDALRGIELISFLYADRVRHLIESVHDFSVRRLVRHLY